MTTTTALRAAREYLRVSKGKGRTARSIDDQHTENVASSDEFGPWTWGTPYADTGSASKYATKARDDFDRLLADLTSGEFGRPGDVLVLWEISRLSRETGKGVAIVDLCEAHGYLVHITSHERPPYNPQNYNDRHELISGIADAEKEARRLSARVLKGTNGALSRGEGHGICPFGYARDYELKDGRPRPVRQYEEEHEAPLVRELFARVHAGKSIKSVADDWKLRGITSRSGVPFSRQTLRNMLTRVVYIGLRMHKGQTVKASWAGIVEPEVFYAVQAILADPTRRTYTGEGVKHAYTTTVRCDECGGPIVNRYKKSPQGEYACQDKGCVWVDKTEVDEIVTAAIVADLSRPEIYGPLSTDDDGEAVSVRAELSAKRADLAEMKAASRPRSLSAVLLLAEAIDALEADIATLSARQSAASRPNKLAGLFAPGPDVAARWADTDVSTQRAIAAILLTPENLGQVRITHAPESGVRVPAADRIVWATAA